MYYSFYFCSSNTLMKKMLWKFKNRILVYLFLKFYFIFKLYIIVLVLPNIKMNPPQVYMCSPSWTLLPPPSPYHLSGLSQCTSPKHPVSCIEPGLATRFIHDILHVSMPFSQIFSWINCCFSYCKWQNQTIYPLVFPTLFIKFVFKCSLFTMCC